MVAKEVALRSEVKQEPFGAVASSTVAVIPDDAEVKELALSTWPKQASRAVRGEWDDLEARKDRLKWGREV